MVHDCGRHTVPAHMAGAEVIPLIEQIYATRQVTDADGNPYSSHPTSIHKVLAFILRNRSYAMVGDFDARGRTPHLAQTLRSQLSPSPVRSLSAPRQPRKGLAPPPLAAELPHPPQDRGRSRGLERLRRVLTCVITHSILRFFLQPQSPPRG